MICAFLLARHLCMPRQLIEETLDSSGHPLTTSTSLLRDIVLPPSLFSKLLASLSASAPSAGRSGSKRSYLSHKGVVTRGQTLTYFGTYIRCSINQQHNRCLHITNIMAKTRPPVCSQRNSLRCHRRNARHSRSVCHLGRLGLDV